MIRFLSGLFIVLHGLVHMWYFTLSQRLVEFQPEMGWTGRSWLFSNFFRDSSLRAFASVLYILATVAFVASGIGIFARAEWLRPMILGSAMFSSALILLFWDGDLDMLVQKGILGILINAIVLIGIFLLHW